MVKLLIGADICPTKNDIKYFIKGDIYTLFNDLLIDFLDNDLFIANLETPLINHPTPIKKSGANFGSSPEILSAIKKAGINLLNLCNNHILDHGEKGLLTTIEYLKKYQINYTGIGLNIEEASTPYFFTKNDLQICILTYAEHEFSFATKNKGGANPFSLIDFTKKILTLKPNIDFFILLYHGGKEYYPYPTPYQKKLMEFFIDMGVNVVLCQHSHVAGAIQHYKNGVIFYGQGNFLFDPIPHPNKELYKGFIIKLIIENKNSYTYSIIPHFHKSIENKNHLGIKKMNHLQKKLFLEQINNYSKNLSDEFVLQEWKKLAHNKKSTYLSILKGNNKILTKFYQYTGLWKLLYNNQNKYIIRNLISCESHRELLLYMLDENYDAIH